MMTLMMNISSQENASSKFPNNNNNNNNNLNIPITTTTYPTWKLYENPFYISHHKPPQQKTQQHSTDHQEQIIHRLHLPVSSRKFAASFWDLTFISKQPLNMESSELETARAQIADLKAELQRQRRATKKTESLNKKLVKELCEARKGKEALERVCEKLAGEISSDKAEITRMRMEMDDERKMLRMAEVIREERVQMKLAEAKLLLEEKLSELEIAKKLNNHNDNNNRDKIINNDGRDQTCLVEKLRFVMQRKQVSVEAENPHIKRGIKGFVEFPKVVRAVGCRSSSGKGLDSKLECQKAQLSMLLKQKGSIRFNGLMAS